MSVRLPSDEPERPVDLTSLTEDDLLLDQLGRGEIVNDAGEVEAMLSGWRASLPAPRPVDRRLLAATTQRSRARRLARTALGVVVAAAFAGGGVTAAAANAGPDSPLWPVTRLMYRDAAESKLAAQEAGRAVTDAEAALNHGQVDEASRLLEQAANRIQAVNDPTTADDLRARLDAVRAQLSASGKVVVPPAAPKNTNRKPPPVTSTQRAPTPSLEPVPEPEAAPDVSSTPAKPPETQRPSSPSAPSSHPVEPPTSSAKRGHR